MDRGTGAPMSRFGVASKHTTLGTCSALRGTFVARLANTASIGFTSLRAIDDSGSQRTRVSHYVRRSNGSAYDKNPIGRAHQENAKTEFDFRRIAAEAASQALFAVQRAGRHRPPATL